MAAAKKCPPCTVLEVSRKAVRNAKSCGDKARAFSAFKSAAAAKVTSGFTSRAEKEKLYKEILRADMSVQKCSRPSVPTAVAKEAAIDHSDVWRRVADAAAARQGQEMIGSGAMDGLGRLGRRRRRRR